MLDAIAPLAAATDAAGAAGGQSALHVACFYAFAALAVVPGLMIIGTRDIARAAFLLLGSLAGVAGLYAMLGADFVAFTQVLVYIGGILVLLLFGVMLTNREAILLHRAPTHALVGAGLLAGLLLLAGTLYVATSVRWQTLPAEMEPTSHQLGDLLMTDFLLPFEIVSVLLLAALVGAATMARRRGDTTEPD